VLYDSKGTKLWGDVDYGHMDMGWVARLNNSIDFTAMSIRIGSKTCGPDGRFHQERDEFIYNALTGEKVSLPFSIYLTLPVDIDGDGYHELVRGVPGGNGEILDAFGNVYGTIGGTVSILCKLLNHPGEQILTHYPDGTVRIWGDRNAYDSPEALRRYNHSYYKVNQKLTAVGYNLVNLGGI